MISLEYRFAYKKLILIECGIIFLAIVTFALGGIDHDVLPSYLIFDLFSPSFLFVVFGIGLTFLMLPFSFFPLIPEKVRLGRQVSWYDKYLLQLALNLVATSCLTTLIIQAYIYYRTAGFSLLTLFLTNLNIVQNVLLSHLVILLIKTLFPKLNQQVLACGIFIFFWAIYFSTQLTSKIDFLTGAFFLVKNNYQSFFYYSLIMWGIILLLNEVNRKLYLRKEYV